MHNTFYQILIIVIGLLCSANNDTRGSAVLFIKRLVSNCSDTGSCVEINNHLLSILTGKGEP